MSDILPDPEAHWASRPQELLNRYPTSMYESDWRMAHQMTQNLLDTRGWCNRYDIALTGEISMVSAQYAEGDRESRLAVLMGRERKLRKHLEELNTLIDWVEPWWKHLSAVHHGRG